MLEIYQEMANIVSRGGQAVLATVVASGDGAPRKAGAKMLVRQDGTIMGTIGGGRVEHLIHGRAIDIMKTGEAEIVHFDSSGEDDRPGMICGGQMDIFLEPIVPREQLYLFGAGHIARSVAAIARKLGFRITVIDPRAEYNNSQQFPDADSRIVADFATASSGLTVDRGAFIVILTAGHKTDEQCLEFALGTGASYIGMIGSQRKIEEVKRHLVDKGISPQKLEEVHAPIGLAIGAETPEEIAVSIIAEIIGVRRAENH